MDFVEDSIFVLTEDRKTKIVEELINSDKEAERDLGVVVMNDLPVGTKITTGYLGVCEDPQNPDLGEMIAILAMDLGYDDV